MSKYEALGKFLRSQQGERVPMSFTDIERVIGGKLPPSARKHRPWWSNNPTNSVMTKVWLAAGFESEQVDIASRRLVFHRVRRPGGASSVQPRHPAFGALKGMASIAPGVDLTKPADPDWGDVYEDS